MEWKSLVPELVVADFSRSVHFYVSVLGFSIKYQRSDPSFAYLEFEGSQIMIEALQANGRTMSELSHPFGRGMNLQIECADVAEIRQRVAEADIAVERELHEALYEAAGVTIRQRQFTVADPDGYLLRFCQIVGRRARDE